MEQIVEIRKKRFFESLNVSKNTMRNYRVSINSSLVKQFVKSKKYSSIFEIDDLNVLWDLYSVLNLHPKNIAAHRSYSAAIMKYIRFLNNGAKIGRRVDYKKKRVIEVKN